MGRGNYGRSGGGTHYTGSGGVAVAGTSGSGGGRQSGSSGFVDGTNGSEIGAVPTPSTQRPDSTTSAATTSKSMSVFLWKSGEMSAMDDDDDFRNFTIRPAIVMLVMAFVFITIAFCTPAWLETDGDLPQPNKFIRIGLWEGCFDQLADETYRYDIKVSGCWYLLAEELYHLWDLIFQPFFVAVQFFFTMCFILLLFSCVLVPMYLLCFGPEHQYFVLLIRVIGITLLSSALLGSIAVIVFGAMGDSRVWMPDWQNNYLSWSFAFAVVGVFCEYVSGVLFLVECKVQARKKRLRESQSAYTMETKA